MKILEFDSLDLAFDNRKILSSVYMRCAQGDVVGLLGRNGSGKSSLMKVVFGILSADHKSVRIDSVALQGDYNRKRIIAYLPQDKFIPSYVSLQAAFQLLKVDMDEIISIIPEIRDWKQFKPNQLSGGWLRLIEALLILYSPSPFCMLDEPFTGLMPIHIETLKGIITEVKGEKASSSPTTCTAM